jgi:hypothetical protein
MLELWLRSGSAGIVLVPFILLYGIAAAIVWLTHLSPARPFFASCIGIAGPFFASVAVLFSLFAAFLANDVQHRDAEAKGALFREADGLRTIMRLAEGLGPVGDGAKAAALSYAQDVLTKELPAARQFDAVPQNLASVRYLTQAIVAPQSTGAIPEAPHEAMLDALVQIRQARLERLALTAGISDPMNWYAMLILGVLTQVAVAVVQLDKMRPQALALFVFSTAFAATVVMVGLNERPFSGRAIDDVALRAAIASAAAP